MSIYRHDIDDGVFFDSAQLAWVTSAQGQSAGRRTVATTFFISLFVHMFLWLCGYYRLEIGYCFLDWFGCYAGYNDLHVYHLEWLAYFTF